MTPATFLELAQEAGRRLCDGAFWDGGMCCWTGDEAIDAGKVLHRSLGGDLYGGTAGVAWFLAHLAGDDDRAADTASAAARHALSRVSDDGGLYSGASGVACAAAGIGERLNDRWLVEAAADLVRRVALGELTCFRNDLMVGRAGVILALLAMRGRLGEGQGADLTEAALVHGAEIVAQAKPRFGGLCWPGSDPGEPALCGMGHGAGGIALALAELGAATGCDRYLDASLRALRYERAWFSREVGNWPDLRDYHRSTAATGAKPSSDISWCNGASGAAIVRLRVFELTGNRGTLGEAGAAVERATVDALRMLKRSADRDSYGRNFSLCHGIASITEMHLVAARVTGDPQHLEFARTIAHAGLRSAVASADPTLHEAFSSLTGGVSGGSAPGLMLGTAGIGAALLRLADPSTMPSPLAPWAWSTRLSAASVA